MIENGKSAQLKRVQKLMKNPRFRRQEKRFVAEGWKMIAEALSRNMVETLYVSAEQEERLRDIPGLESTRVELVSSALFRELSDTVTPQGALAVTRMPEYDRDALCEAPDAAFLCLENVQDPGNLGTMIRTAEGAGMSAVVMSRGCADLFNPKVVRSTMGALLRVPYYICEDMAEEAALLKRAGFTLYAAHLRGSCDYTEECYEGKLGILIGNEASGLTDAVAAAAERKVKIPMEGEVESLNAAVSAALLMYEVRRKRLAKPPVF